MVIIPVILGLFLIGFFATADDGPGNQDGITVSDPYPKIGFGSQFVYPSGGLSSRFWLSPRLGGEVNAILWSNRSSGVNGTVSVRVLSKLSDGEIVDFYVAGGGAYNFGYGDPDISLVGTGGISFRVFSDNFRVNLEFGMQGQGTDQFGMTFGSGFHYYF